MARGDTLGVDMVGTQKERSPAELGQLAAPSAPQAGVTQPGIPGQKRSSALTTQGSHANRVYVPPPSCSLSVPGCPPSRRAGSSGTRALPSAAAIRGSCGTKNAASPLNPELRFDIAQALRKTCNKRHSASASEPHIP